jgi:hypothetical protein
MIAICFSLSIGSMADIVVSNDLLGRHALRAPGCVNSYIRLLE